MSEHTAAHAPDPAPAGTADGSAAGPPVGTGHQPSLLDVGGTVRWLRREGAEAVLLRLVGVLEEDLRRWAEFERIPRIASHSPVGVIELMPISDGRLYAFKYVNGHPVNPSRGLQTVTAFGALADVATGYPLLLAEMTLLTALRTAAMSALAARHLARPGARVHAMIGAGSQAEFQALAMRAVLGLDRVQVLDPDLSAIATLRRNLEPLGFEIRAAATLAEALDGADVVTTCTAAKARQAVLHRQDLRPGLHLNAIGGDCPGKTELAPEVVRASRVVVEFAPQTRIEGEIQQVEPDFPVTELWEIVTGAAPGRRTATDAGPTGTTGPEADADADADEVTLFDSVGFALADFSVLRLAHAATAGTDLVTPLDLVAAPSDPKDLFSLLR